MATAPATEAREKGNKAFGKGRFVEARHWYTRALELDPKDAMSWSNRSATHLKLNAPHLALTDGFVIMGLRPDWPKCYMRAGVASLAMGGCDDAIELYQSGILCATMQQMSKEEKSLKKYLSKAQKRKKKEKDDLHYQLAKQLGFDSCMFYTPVTLGHNPRKISVRDNDSVFAALTACQSVEVRDAAYAGGGRGLYATAAFKAKQTVFKDEPILSISYGAKQCCLTGERLGASACKSSNGHEMYAKPSSKRLAEKQYMNGISDEVAGRISKLRQDLDKANSPLPSSYHVLAAIRVACMQMTNATALPLQVLDLLSRPSDLPEKQLEERAFKMPFTERYNQHDTIMTVLGLSETETRFDFQWYDHLWGAFHMNAIGQAGSSATRGSVGNSTIREIEATHIMAIGSFMNHSSRPNVKAVFDQSSNVIRFEALRGIEEGDEIVIDYCDAKLSAEDRKELLYRQYFIDSTPSAPPVPSTAGDTKPVTNATETISSEKNQRKQKQKKKINSTSATSSSKQPSKKTAKPSAKSTPSGVAKRSSPSGVAKRPSLSADTTTTTTPPVIPPTKPTTKVDIAPHAKQPTTHDPQHTTPTPSPPPPHPTPPSHPLHPDDDDDDDDDDGPTPEEKRAMEAEIEAAMAMQEFDGGVGGGSVFDELD